MNGGKINSLYQTIPLLYTVYRDEKLQRIYHEQIRSHSHALFCRDGIDGSLRGLVTFDLQHKETYTVIGV